MLQTYSGLVDGAASRAGQQIFSVNNLQICEYLSCASHTVYYLIQLLNPVPLRIQTNGRCKGMNMAGSSNAAAKVTEQAGCPGRYL